MIRHTKREWTKEEDSFLVEHNYDMNTKELCNALNRTQYSIQKRTATFGLHLFYGITPYQQEMILSNTHISFDNLAYELNMSKSGVQSVIKKFVERKERRILFMSDLKPILKNNQYRRIMELHLGRRLIKGEVVHHINMDKSNNNISNLYLCNKSEHQKSHGTLNKVVSNLMKRGIIKFVDGEYVIVE